MKKKVFIIVSLLSIIITILAITISRSFADVNSYVSLNFVDEYGIKWHAEMQNLKGYQFKYVKYVSGDIPEDGTVVIPAVVYERQANNAGNDVRWDFHFNGYNDDDYIGIEMIGSTSSGAVGMFEAADAATKAKIKKIVVPGTIKTVGDKCFDGLTNLQELELGEGIQSLGNNFISKTKISELTIPNSIKSFNNSKLYNSDWSQNTYLQKINWGNGVPASDIAGIGDSYCFPNLKSYGATPDSGFTEEDGVVYKDDGKTLYAVPEAKDLTNWEVPDEVTAIGDYVFYDHDNLYKMTNDRIFKEGLISIGNYSFERSYFKEALTLPSTVQYIGDHAFYGAYGSTIPATNNFTLPEGLKVIGSGAFYKQSNLKGALVIPETVTSIGDYAFYTCTGFTGTLTIPDSVVTIGKSAFEDCSGLKGKLTVGNGTKTIGERAFYKQYVYSADNNWYRPTIGSSAESIGANFINGKYIPDIWIDTIPGETYVTQEYAGKGNETHVHFRGCTHRVTIGTSEGIRIVNAETGEELVTGNYVCGTELKYKVVLDEGYDYSGLKVIVIDDDKFTNKKIYEYEEGREYDFDELLRNRRIYVETLTTGSDLSLRTYITDVNYISVSKVREPLVELSKGVFTYTHTKYPIRVSKDDDVTFKISVYNESVEDVIAQEIKVYIPEGMELDPENPTNKRYNWTLDSNGNATSNALAGEAVQGYFGNGNVSHKDLSIVLKVTEEGQESDMYKTIFAEINRQSATDNDSTPGNVQVSQNYMIDEINESNGNSIINSQEDDDDFETVVLNAKVKVEYNIRVNKIDEDTNEKLRGAKFNLISCGVNELEVTNEDNTKELKTFNDGEVIAVAISDEEGIVDFGGIVSYDEGENTYYIEEVDAPESYLANIGQKMKVRVVKYIIDAEKGTYGVKVYCDTSSYTVDTTQFEFTPISTPEQLAKVGSGETVNVNGTDYEFNIDTNYKLINDIDLEGINWTPINYQIKGIFDGDGHTIRNLTIQREASETKEVGLLGYFSGIVENLTFENPKISVLYYDEVATSRSGYSGVGCFAGVMEQGALYNVKTTTTEGATSSISASVDNIGGIIGHTMPEGLVTVINCENNAPVIGNSYSLANVVSTSASNVGGIIGCALGSVTVEDSVNNGRVIAERYNAGGLVGFVRPTDYREMFLAAGYDEDNKRIDLLVENKAAEGQYNLSLEIKDRKTSELLGGATYEVDKVENTIMTKLIDTGSLKLFDKVIEYAGKDIYFLTEEESIPGYTKLNGIIKTTIERFWDNAAQDYKVRVEAVLVSHKEYQEFIGERETREDNVRGSEFDRGEIFTDVNIAKANWNGKKVSFERCTNNGVITANYMNAAGILGTSYGLVDFNNCTNNGTITGSYKTAGMLAELRTVNISFYDPYRAETTEVETINEKGVSEFNNCKNNGQILNTASSTGYSAGGIAANTVGNVVFKECENAGEIISGGITGGIVAEARMGTTIKNCINKGFINHISTYTNLACGGIVGQEIYESYASKGISISEVYLDVENCKNYANITSKSWAGGIVGMTTGQSVRINNCKLANENPTEKLSITVNPYGGATAGIIAGSAAKEIILTNNLVNNCEIEIKPGNVNTTDTNAAGMLACVQSSICGGYQNEPEKIVINNCLTKDTTIKGTGKQVGGILGEVDHLEGIEVAINNCMVDNSELQTRVNNGSTYGWIGGIAVGGYGSGHYNIRNCVVKDTNMKCTNLTDGPVATYCLVGGIFGKASAGGAIGTTTINIEDCDVINNDMYAYTEDHTPGGSGGIMGCLYGGDTVTISRCNVKQSSIKDHAHMVGGIVGQITYVNKYEITDCNVYETDILRTKSTPGEQDLDSIAGGILGFSMGAKNAKISNCKVIGKELEKGNEGRNKIGVDCNGPAGILGKAISAENLEVVNNQVKNMDIIDNDPVSKSGNYNDVGGIASFLYFTNYYGENNIVDNCTIYGKKLYNAAGAYATLQGNNMTIRNEKITNCNITNETTLSDNRGSSVTVGGMIGVANTQVVAEDCEVKNCKLYAGDHMAAGGIGYAYGKVTASNCNIDNVEIVDTWENPEGPVYMSYINMRQFAGFLGGTSSESTLNNIHVNDVKITGKYLHMGGIVGCAYSSADITNCTVENSTFKSEKSVACMYQAAGGIAAEQMNGTNKNNKVLNSTITVDAHLVGGIVGHLGHDTTNMVIEDALVDNLTVVHNNIKHPYTDGSGSYIVPREPALGGIVGTTAGSVKNSQVKNSSITVKENENLPVHVGGIVGGALGAKTIENVKVINTDIDNKAASGQVGGAMSAPMHSCTGGLVGIATAALTVTDSSVLGDSTIKGTSHVGGLVGYALNNGASLSNDTVQDTTITNIGTDANSTIMGRNVSCTGGAISIVHDSTSLNGITVKDTTITNTQSNGHIGGVVGVSTGSIKNITMSNVNVSGNGIAGGVGAIIEDKANTSLSDEDRKNVISDLTLDTVSVTSNRNHAGGIAGVFNASEVKNATVKNSTIKTLAGTFTLGEDLLPTCIGAIFGVGKVGVIITAPTVQNNTLTGATGSIVGKYVGAPTDQNDALVAAE